MTPALLHLVVFVSKTIHLIALGKDGIGKLVERKGSRFVCRDGIGRELHRARNAVHNGKERISLNLRILYSLVERFIAVLLILSSIGHKYTIFDLLLIDGLMSSLVQQVHASHADEHHLQEGISDKHTDKNGCQRQHIVLQT